MSDQANTALREEVRSRYAEAARVVLEPTAGVTASCCANSATDSCCSDGPAAAEAVGGFSENLYRDGETDGLLTLARTNAARDGARNVEFLKGEIEALPLPDASMDVVTSNCVINLSTDKHSAIIRAVKPVR